MDGVAAGATGHVDDFVDVKIAFASRCRADRMGFIRETHVERFAVDFAKDSDGADSEFAAGAQDAHGDFTAIGNQDFLEHAVGDAGKILACDAGGADSRNHCVP